MHPLATEPEHLQRGVHGNVRLRADHDFDLGAPVEAAGLDVPAEALRESMAGGGQGREIGRLAAGDEADARAGGQAEEFAQPAAAASSATEFGWRDTNRPAFWSQVEVSQSAATVTGSVPPTTKPK